MQQKSRTSSACKAKLYAYWKIIPLLPAPAHGNHDSTFYLYEFGYFRYIAASSIMHSIQEVEATQMFTEDVWCWRGRNFSLPF